MLENFKKGKALNYLVLFVQTLGWIVMISNSWSIANAWGSQNVWGPWSAGHLYLMFISTMMVMAPHIVAGNKPQRRAYTTLVIGATLVWLGFTDDKLLIFAVLGVLLMAGCGYQLFKIAAQNDREVD